MAPSERDLFGDIPSPVSLLGDADTELFTLALALIPGMGPRRGACALAKFGSARAVFESSRRDLEDAGLSGSLAQSVLSGDSFEEAILQREKAADFGTNIIPLGAPLYPTLLSEIADPPLVLFAKGDTTLLNAISIGVVGTRRPTVYGKAVAERLSKEISDLGITVVSGMARGVDTYAHRAALAGKGGTIAVFGCGVDVIYPAENRALASEIADAGLVLSEFPMGSPSYPQNFPVRNRIVSGLGRGILVVEGAQYSGSAITARIAVEQGRLVFAVPGNITSRMSWGPNLLIKQGATLVQDAMDVLSNLDVEDRSRVYQRLHGTGEPAASPAETSPGDAPPRGATGSRILRALKVDEGRSLDDLLEAFPDMSSSEIIAAMFELEMEGAVKQDAGQRYTKIWC
ncbi:MAG: DNA-protecting protein DprA [Bryobacterales bacterium]|nr:DNA-protecting protein DprA [Bryobacterales bacterium]